MNYLQDNDWPLISKHYRNPHKNHTGQGRKANKNHTGQGRKALQEDETSKS